MKEMAIVRQIANAINREDYILLGDLLTNDFIYSEDGINICGKVAYLENIKQKLEAYNKQNIPFVADIGMLDEEPGIWIDIGDVKIIREHIAIKSINERACAMNVSFTIDAQPKWYDVMPNANHAENVQYIKDDKANELAKLNPNAENCLQYCIDGNIAYKVFTNFPLKNPHIINLWTSAYAPLNDFKFPEFLETHEQVVLFKKSYKKHDS